jgi:hypothetical protein
VGRGSTDKAEDSTVSKVLPSRERGHLAVAAVRVLGHLHASPPSAAQIAELLQWGDEETHFVLRGLVDTGILREHKTPFEPHYELSDHHLVESLRLEAEKEVLGDEVEDFKRRAKSRHEKLENMFRSGEQEKQKQAKQSSLEQQFADFKKKKPRPLS